MKLPENKHITKCFSTREIAEKMNDGEYSAEMLLQHLAIHWNRVEALGLAHGSPVLCYVSGCWAYFTTRKLSEQWGDDWSDAPYEHNAETPYEYGEHDRNKGRAPWTITKVAFDGDFEPPCEGHCNSPWSVEQINAGAVAWLRTSRWHGGKPVIVPAGTTLERFCELIREGGGNVYLANAPGQTDAESGTSKTQ